MESMSGHGRGAASTEGWRITAECASVNRKGIEIAVALPKAMSTLEPRIREEVQRSVRRGRVNVTVAMEAPQGGGSEQSVVYKAAARRALRDLKALSEEFSLPGEISLELLLRSPGVLKNPGEEIPAAESLWPAVQTALGLALEKMCAMRRKEGSHLAADLIKRLRLLETSAKAVRSRIPGLTRQRRDHMRGRLEELGVKISAEDQSVAKELALLAERSDITEELTRLESHFLQFREALAGTDPAGRTLDYLAQEMFREVNTLGNKAGDAQISRRVVQSKAELDRIREQVANLE